MTNKLEPALARCGPAFWSLMQERGIALPPKAKGDTRHEHEMRRLRLRRTAKMTLTEVAEALELPPVYARGYLRSVHELLKRHGVLLLECRLVASDDLESGTANFIPAFVPPAEFEKRRQAEAEMVGELKELKTRIAKGDKWLAANARERGSVAFAKAEKLYDELCEERDALEARLVNVSTSRRDSQYHQLPRVAYAVFTFPARMPNFTNANMTQEIAS